MTDKFNPKQYRGKNKIFVAVPFAPRVTRIWVWSETYKEYRPAEVQKQYVGRRWELRNGERIRAYQCFESLETVRAWQDETELSLTSNEVQSLDRAIQKDKGRLFSDVIEEWKRRRFSAMEPSTQIRYQNIIDLYFGSLLGLGINELTPQRIDLWIDELKDPEAWTMKSKKRKMFDHELSLLSTILKYYIDYHDEPNFQFPIKKRHKEAVWLKRNSNVGDKQLPEDQFLRFRVEMVKLPQGDVLSLMATVQYYQALRISEVAALYWEDISFDWTEPHLSRLKVRRKIYWPRKKGIASEIKDGFKNADSSDNQGVKEQPLFPESCDALLKLYKSGAKGLIFRTDESHFAYRILQKRYDRAFERADLHHRGTHIMRHGGCSRLFDERGDLGVAKQILGNSSLRSVEVYARRSKRALSDVAQKHWERRGLQVVTGGNGERSETALCAETGN